MADLESCYFCAAPGDVSEVAVIPPRHAPTDAEQRRVALCPDCRTKLTDVLRPLAERLDREVDGGDDDGAVETVDPEPVPDPAEPAGGADVDDDAEPSVSSAPEVEDVEAAEADDEAAEADDVAGDHSSEATAETSGSAGDDEPSVADADTDPTADADTDPTADATAETPENYGTVMRLLENREFPVDRADLEVVALNAYDMSAQELDDVVQAAVDRGVLETDGDEIRWA